MLDLGELRLTGWRTRWSVDAALAALLSLAVLASVWSPGPGWAWFEALLVAVPLAVRRRWPLTCFAVQLAGLALAGRISAAPPAALLAIAMGGFTATAVTGRWPRVLAAVGMTGIAILIHRWTGTGSSVLLLVAIWLLVYAVRTLWLRSQTAEQFASALRREQEARSALAVKAERARLTRELHDVIGHNVAVMMIQAGAARLAVDDRPDVSTALREVESAGRETMIELRRMLDLLDAEPGSGGDPPEDELSPQPGLTELDSLVSRVRAAGLPVSLAIEGTSRRLDPGVDLAAYRVVQEGLTNALKYAGGASTVATVAYDPAGLTVTVRDHGRAGAADGRDGSGRGLLGLRERVALYHGRFEAGRQPDGGYRVHAYFPFEPS